MKFYKLALGVVLGSLCGILLVSHGAVWAEGEPTTTYPDPNQVCNWTQAGGAVCPPAATNLYLAVGTGQHTSGFTSTDVYPTSSANVTITIINVGVCPGIGDFDSTGGLYFTQYTIENMAGPVNGVYGNCGNANITIVNPVPGQIYHLMSQVVGAPPGVNVENQYKLSIAAGSATIGSGEYFTGGLSLANTSLPTGVNFESWTSFAMYFAADCTIPKGQSGQLLFFDVDRGLYQGPRFAGDSFYPELTVLLKSRIAGSGAGWTLDWQTPAAVTLTGGQNVYDNFKPWVTAGNEYRLEINHISKPNALEVDIPTGFRQQMVNKSCAVPSNNPTISAVIDCNGANGVATDADLPGAALRVDLFYVGVLQASGSTNAAGAYSLPHVTVGTYDAWVRVYDVNNAGALTGAAIDSAHTVINCPAPDRPPTGVIAADCKAVSGTLSDLDWPPPYTFFLKVDGVIQPGGPYSTGNTGTFSVPWPASIIDANPGGHSVLISVNNVNAAGVVVGPWDLVGPNVGPCISASCMPPSAPLPLPPGDFGDFEEGTAPALSLQIQNNNSLVDWHASGYNFVILEAGQGFGGVYGPAQLKDYTYVANSPTTALATVTPAVSSALAPGNYVFGFYIQISPGFTAPPIGFKCEGRYRIIKKPYMRVYGGETAAGVGFGAACTAPAAPIDASDNQDGSGNWIGAGSQLGVYSGSTITGLVSASLLAPTAPGTLAFANSLPPPAPPAIGGSFGSTLCAPDYWPLILPTGSSLPGPAAAPIINPAVGGKYSVTGPISLSQAGASLLSTSTVIYVTGNLTITSNLVTSNGATAWATPGAIPSLYVIVKGNIYIKPGVTQLDGLYVAEPTGPNDGRIFTCYNTTDANTIDLGSNGNWIANNCTNKLTVNGAFIANKVNFMRIKGSVHNGIAREPASDPNSNIAEIFQYAPELIVNRPAIDPEAGSTKLDSVVTLSPSL